MVGSLGRERQGVRGHRNDRARLRQLSRAPERSFSFRFILQPTMAGLRRLETGSSIASSGRRRMSRGRATSSWRIRPISPRCSAAPRVWRTSGGTSPGCDRRVDWRCSSRRRAGLAGLSLRRKSRAVRRSRGWKPRSESRRNGNSLPEPIGGPRFDSARRNSAKLHTQK